MRIFAGVCLGLLLSAAVPAQAELLRVSGRVVAAQGGQGLAGIEIHAIRAGQRVLVATTNANGDYAASAEVPAGTYRLSAQSPAAQYYVGKVHPDTTCYGPCNTGTWGTTAFKVPSTQPATQIDFALAQGGRATLTIKGSDTNQPLASVLGSVSNSDGDGAYRLPSGADGIVAVPPLPVGTYNAGVTGPNGYISERHANLQCPLINPSCGTPTPVTITAGATTALAFSLERGISIRGRLLGPQGEPVAGTVSVYQRSGGSPVSAVSWAYAGDDGYYETNDTLPPGQYGLIASSRDGNYSAAVYPNVACSTCDPRGSGAAVTVGNQSVSGINFSLQAAAVIRGKLLLPEDNFSYMLKLYSAATLQETGAIMREADGGYRFEGLLPGTYYVSVQPTMDYSYLGELYNRVSCPAGQPCDLSLGTPISIGAGGIADHIDLRIVSDRIFADGLQTP